MKNFNRAISPKEAIENRSQEIPDFVFVAVNYFLCLRISNTRIIITQDELIDKIQEQNSGITRTALFANYWLDFENAYKEKGWKVHYEKQCIRDSGCSHWEFNKKNYGR